MPRMRKEFSQFESIDATHGSKAQSGENAWVLVERVALNRVEGVDRYRYRHRLYSSIIRGVCV